MAKSVKGKYLNPKADLTFKLIFNEHPDLVMSLSLGDAGPDEFYHDYAIVNGRSSESHQACLNGRVATDEGEANVEHSDRIIEGLRFVFIDLKKFFAEQSGKAERKPKTIAEKKMAVLWLRFLTEIDEFTQVVPEELLENADMRRALEIVEKAA